MHTVCAIIGNENENKQNEKVRLLSTMGNIKCGLLKKGSFCNIHCSLCPFIECVHVCVSDCVFFSICITYKWDGSLCVLAGFLRFFL